MRQRTHHVGLSVALMPRQHAAVRSYADYLGVSMSAYVRALLVNEIPAEFWEREEPPPGQLTFDEGAWLRAGKNWQVEEPRRVRFTSNDPAGLWLEGELADDLGPEAPGLPVRRLRILAHDDRPEEVITLTDPYERGLIE